LLNALYWDSINSNAIMVSERTAFFTGCIVSGNNNLTIARQQVGRQHHGLVIVPIGLPAGNWVCAKRLIRRRLIPGVVEK
jgi:hypothetical protein